MSKQIIGISFAVEDDGTGAVAMFHVLEYLAIDYKLGSCNATVNGYVSQKAYEDGKNPLCSHSLNISDLPGNSQWTRDWLYLKAVETDNVHSIFSGAELITVD